MVRTNNSRLYYGGKDFSCFIAIYEIQINCMMREVKKSKFIVYDDVFGKD